MSSSQPVEYLDKTSGGFLLRLNHFKNNPHSVLDRIPGATSGVYSWFRNYTFAEDSDMLFDQIIGEIERPKFATRRGSIAPYYEVAVSSRCNFSENKIDSLKSALKDRSFRSIITSTLNSSIYFQTPLYIGKAKDLKSRISQHLAPESPLRGRFAEYGVNIYTTSLLIVPAQVEEPAYPTEHGTEVGRDIDDIGNESPEAVQKELLLEEIFSRLFHPQLTLRIG